LDGVIFGTCCFLRWGVVSSLINPWHMTNKDHWWCFNCREYFWSTEMGRRTWSIGSYKSMGLGRLRQYLINCQNTNQVLPNYDCTAFLQHHPA
jgi:hypothetical protein